MSRSLKVWFAADGTPIHAGEWDFRVECVEVGTREIEVEVSDEYVLQPGEEWTDETSGSKKVKRTEPIFEERAMNPMPDGAYCEDREVVQDDEGGLHLAGYIPPESPVAKVANLEAENALIALELAQTQYQLKQIEQEQASLLLELVSKEVL